MAATGQEQQAKPTLLDSCKKKFSDIRDEVINNLKMCYCPCQADTYAVSNYSDEPVPLQQLSSAEKDTGEITHTQQEPVRPTWEQLEALDIPSTIYPTLGFYFRISQTRINEICNESSTTSEGLRKIYQEWLAQDINVSWRSLVGALEDMNLVDKADEIRRKYLVE